MVGSSLPCDGPLSWRLVFAKPGFTAFFAEGALTEEEFEAEKRRILEI